MSELNPSGGRFSVWQVIAISASVAVVSSGAGWTVGRTLLGDELEQYRKADQWKIPDTLRKLGELSQRVTISLDERARLDKAILTSEALEKENKQLRMDVTETKALASTMKARLQVMEGDTFELVQGETRFLIGRDAAIGITTANPYGMYCTVQLGDRQLELRPGQTLQEVRGNKVARVTLLEVKKPESCKFAIDVK